jgi:DNA-binding response OmpR family regulator
MSGEKGKLILLVEDNSQIISANKRMLERAGYKALSALTLSSARVLMEERRPDLIILDILMPDGNGLDFVYELREGDNSGIPVLMLTGLTAKQDVVRGLKAGGDDYLTKPYDFPELLARVEALLRRAERVPQTVEKGRLSLDVAACIASLDGTDLLLTKKEFALLLLFVQNEERFMSGDSLYEKVWRRPMGDDNEAVKSSIKRLRAKISGSGFCIAWSRGEGYCFEKE